MAWPIVLDRDAIAGVCERFGVKRLVVFGSAVTERFDESSSDFDFLVEFRDDLTNRFDAYFGRPRTLPEFEDRSDCPRDWFGDAQRDPGLVVVITLPPDRSGPGPNGSRATDRGETWRPIRQRGPGTAG